jgi:NADPH:quinone reductase-like Zn-dependent oxidoreductase
MVNISIFFLIIELKFLSIGAGEIIEVGDQVIGFKKGDRVISNFDPTHLYGPSRSWHNGLGGPADGMLTQYKALPYFGLVKIPDHLSYEQAASLVCTGTTTWNALHGNNSLLPGQTVLLQGTGGVSLTGLMLAKAGGCTTIITSSSDEKLREVKEKYGADYTINYKTTPNWDEEVLKITKGEGVDIILENGGAATIAKSINAIKMGGIVACIGFLGAGEKPQSPDVALLALGKGCIVRGIVIGSREQTEQLMNLVDQKKLIPPVHKVFNFDPASIKKAYQYLESQTHMGKVCIKVD